MKKTNKTTKITISLVVIGAIGACVFFYLKHDQSQQKEPANGSIRQDSSTLNGSSKPTNKADEKQSVDPSDKTPRQFQSDPNKSPQEQPSQNDLLAEIQGNNLVIRATIPLISEGTCTLTLTKGGAVVTKTATLIINPTNSSCAGWDIPTSELTTGSWSISVQVSASKSYKLTGSINI